MCIVCHSDIVPDNDICIHCRDNGYQWIDTDNTRQAANERAGEKEGER